MGGAAGCKGSVSGVEVSVAPEPADHRTGLGPEADRVAGSEVGIGGGERGDQLGPMGSVEVRKYLAPIRTCALTPPIPLGSDGSGFGWTGEETGRKRTDRRAGGAGVGETGDEGVRDRYRRQSTRPGPISGLFLLGSFECGVDAICRGG